MSLSIGTFFEQPSCLCYPTAKQRDFFLCMTLLSDDCFSVATPHRENVAASAIMQRIYRHGVMPVATPKDGSITGTTSTNYAGEKATQHVQRNTLKSSPFCLPFGTSNRHIHHSQVDDSFDDSLREKLLSLAYNGKRKCS